MLDLAIIGGGPAALSAAIYAGRNGLSVSVFEQTEFGGTLPNIADLENYPGFTGAGRELAQRMREQASAFGARLNYGTCLTIRPDASSFTLDIEGTPVTARAVLVATGSSPRRLEFAPDKTDPKTSARHHSESADATGLNSLPDPAHSRAVELSAKTTDSSIHRSGSSSPNTTSDPADLDADARRRSGSTAKDTSDLSVPVSYCALCDGPLARDKHVAVLGGANSAVQEAIFLANIAADVDLITHSNVKADRQLVARLRALPNVRIIEQTEPTREMLEKYDYCFVYIGRTPATSCLADIAAGLLDDDGYVITLEDSPFAHQTVVPGLFAAGDVRQSAIRQVVTAASDGAIAAIEITRYLRNKF